MLAHSPRIVTDGMVLCLDAGNPRNFNLTAVEVLVVAGGGGGGGRSGGGGGSGGLIYNSNFAVTPGTQLTATVGDGGAGGAGEGAAGSDGANSVFGALTAICGGGGSGDAPTTGRNGGSGGGGKYGSAGGTGTSGQGFAGGSGTSGTWKAGGGGGAGGVGVNGVGSPHKCGDGGPGLGLNISGTFAYYAGGGGGGSHNSDAGGCCDDVTARGFGGIGGGGNGGTPGGYNSGDNATTNTGGGGGGGSTVSSSGGAGGNGGSGIIIVRYPGPQKAIGGTVTSVGGDTIHTFTTSGNFTPLVNTNGSAVLGLSDLSGNRNFGATAGSPTYNSANGGSLYFEGSDEYVTLSEVLTNSGNLTYCAWVYRSVVSPNGYTNLFTSTTQNEQFQLDLTGYPGGFGVYLNGAYNSNTSNLIPLNTWVYICWQRNGTGLYGYLNGVEQFNPSTGNAQGNSTVSTAVSNINKIGAYSTGTSYNLNGKLGPVHMYNRALSAAEVSQNFNALRSRFIQDGSSADRAAPSASHLSSIGIRVDGDYWYSPPGQTTPIQLYTVFSSAPADKGYVLVARGRESTDWWNTSGQNTSALTSTSINTNTPIAVLSNSFVNSLINSQWNGMRFITNRINGGDSWLFVGTTSTTFSWTYFQQSASTVNATATKYNSLFLSGGVALNYGTGVHWTDTLNYGNGNNCDRTFTWSWGGHGTYQGWSGGSGCNPEGAFQNGGEGHSIQLVNCYVEC